MNKHTFFLFLAIIITSCSNAQGNSDIPLPSGKSIYIPKELQGMDICWNGDDMRLRCWYMATENHSRLES